jgi:hypothetical protein
MGVRRRGARASWTWARRSSARRDIDDRGRRCTWGHTHGDGRARRGVDRDGVVVPSLFVFVGVAALADQRGRAIDLVARTARRARRGRAKARARRARGTESARTAGDTRRTRGERGRTLGLGARLALSSEIVGGVAHDGGGRLERAAGLCMLCVRRGPGERCFALDFRADDDERRGLSMATDRVDAEPHRGVARRSVVAVARERTIRVGIV